MSELADVDLHVHDREPLEHEPPGAGIFVSPVEDRFRGNDDDAKRTPANGLDELHEVRRSPTELVDHIFRGLVDGRDELQLSPDRSGRHRPHPPTGPGRGKGHAGAGASEDFYMRRRVTRLSRAIDVVTSFPSIWRKSIQHVGRRTNPA